MRALSAPLLGGQRSRAQRLAMRFASSARWLCTTAASRPATGTVPIRAQPTGEGAHSKVIRNGHVCHAGLAIQTSLELDSGGF